MQAISDQKAYLLKLRLLMSQGYAHEHCLANVAGEDCKVVDS